jgi:uncharacterized membrane protein
MQPLIHTLKLMQLHPFVDHFTVALIVIGVLTDLVASLFPSRLWMRYMALTLMILGAGAAACSNITGGWEADRVWNNVQGPAKDVLHTHAELGDILPWVFGGLALWRLGVQFLGFLHGSRPLYLIAAVVGLCAIIYQGYKGGELVYDYGVGTAMMPMPAAATPEATPTPIETPAPSPSVAPSTPTPNPLAVVPTPAPTVSASPSSPATAETPAAPAPEASPSASPSATSGTPVNPPPGDASSTATPTPHNL